MAASRTLAFCLAFVSVASGWTQQTGKLTYQNPDAPVDARVRDLLSRMTLEEKVAQLESFTNKPVLPGTHLETAIEGGTWASVQLVAAPYASSRPWLKAA
jgi:beta-glucosidase